MKRVDKKIMNLARDGYTEAVYFKLMDGEPKKFTIKSMRQFIISTRKFIKNEKIEISNIHIDKLDSSIKDKFIDTLIKDSVKVVV